MTPHDDTDNLHGVLTGYPCCTANLHQGWPKFVQNLWYATADNGIAALVYAPSTLSAKVADGIQVNITEETAYPFEETIHFTISYDDKRVTKAFFPFHLRVPTWCKNPVIRVNGEVIPVDAYHGEIVRVNREWKEGDKVALELPMELHTELHMESVAHRAAHRAARPQLCCSLPAAPSCVSTGAHSNAVRLQHPSPQRTASCSSLAQDGAFK